MVVQETVIIRFVANMKAFAKNIKMPVEHMKGMYTEQGKLNKRFKQNRLAGGRWALGLRKMTHGLRGFRMEMLGVMFFGMGLSRFFKGLLTPALKATGIFELFSSVLQVVFLPIVLALLPFLIKLATWLMNLSENTKFWAGVLAVIGFVMGTALFLFGMFALGIGSILLVAGPLIAALVMMASSFVSLLASMGKVGAIAGLLTLFLGIIPGVKAASDSVEEQGGIWGWFKGLIGRIIDFIITKVDALWERFLEIGLVKEALNSLGLDVEKLKDPIAFLGEKVKKMWFEFLSNHPKVIDALHKLGLTVDEAKEPWNHIGKIIGGVADIIIDKLSGAVKDTKDSFKEFYDQVMADHPELASNITSLADSLKVIADIMESISNILSIVISKMKQLDESKLGKIIKVTSPLGWFTAAKKAVSTVGNALSPQQSGSAFIPHTGLYKLHAGETVSTGDSFSSSPTINVYASPGMDIRSLAREVSNIVTSDLGRLSRR